MTTIRMSRIVVFMTENGTTAGLTADQIGRDATITKNGRTVTGTLTFVQRYGINMVELGVTGHGTVRCFRDTPVTVR